MFKIRVTFNFLHVLVFCYSEPVKPAEPVKKRITDLPMPPMMDDPEPEEEPEPEPEPEPKKDGSSQPKMKKPR